MLFLVELDGCCELLLILLKLSGLKFKEFEIFSDFINSLSDVGFIVLLFE